MPVEKIIQASLLPRLLHVVSNKSEDERQRLTASFHAHVRILSEFVRHEFMEGGLSISAFVGLHKLLFPPGYLIRAVGNDGVQVETRPGEWRQQVLHPHIVVFSPNDRIASDLSTIIEKFNQIRQPSREDILRFYFLFLTVHPFGDANGSLSALVCDVLCFRHDCTPLWMLNIRFRDKHHLYSLIAEFEENKSESSLANILTKTDAFHRAFPVEVLEEHGGQPSFVAIR